MRPAMARNDAPALEERTLESACWSAARVCARRIRLIAAVDATTRRTQHTLPILSV